MLFLFSLRAFATGWRNLEKKLLFVETHECVLIISAERDNN